MKERRTINTFLGSTEFTYTFNSDYSGNLEVNIFNTDGIATMYIPLRDIFLISKDYFIAKIGSVLFGDIK
jgi:hypothetical protein